METNALLKALQSYVSVQINLQSSAGRYTNKWSVSRRLVRIIKIMLTFITEIMTENKQLQMLMASVLK